MLLIPATQPDDIERVLLAAATAVGAERYWYCEGRPGLAQAMYAGRVNDDGSAQRCYTREPYAGHVPRHQGDRAMPAEAPPDDLDALLAKREALVIPLEKNAASPAFVLLQRPKGFPFGQKSFERQIAAHIVGAHRRYFTAAPTDHPLPDRREQTTFLNGLSALIVDRGLKHKHPESEHHILRMAELTSKLAKEISDNTSMPLKLNDAELKLLHELARLHDADKLQVPEHVLHGGKFDRTSDKGRKMWERMKDHAFNSGQILSVPLLDSKDGPDLGVMVSAHHMQHRGRGYPYEFSTHDGQHSGDYFPPYVDRNAYEAGEAAPIRLPLEAGLFQLCDIFEALSGKRHYQRSHMAKDTKIRPSEVLDKMHVMALEEEINPYLFYYFVQSKTLADYVSADDKMHAHLNRKGGEQRNFKEIRDAILANPELQDMARQASTGYTTLLFKMSPAKPHLPEATRDHHQASRYAKDSRSPSLRSP